MKNINNNLTTRYSMYWLLGLGLVFLIMMSSCTSSSSSDKPVAFTPQNTLDGKVIVLGSQDSGGSLEMYVTGTDLNGNPLTVDQLQTATVSVGADRYTNADPELSIAAVADTEDVLSLSLMTDYSNSTNGELQFVADIFTGMLDSLPPVFEAQVITFSDEFEVQLSWTDASLPADLAAIKAAVAKEHSVRNMTALYDAMGAALEANPGDFTDGLMDRCRPAHMLVVFTDGDDNMSSVYTDSGLASIVNLDKTVVIMLGTSDAEPGVLSTLVGDYGAVVQVNDPGGLPVEVANWAASLNKMVKFTLNVATTGKTVSIAIGSETAEVDPNTHCTL